MKIPNIYDPIASPIYTSVININPCNFQSKPTPLFHQQKKKEIVSL